MKLPFEIAVHEHGPTVLQVCLANLGIRDDADEAWQETFLAALERWPDLDESTNVEAWLVRIAQRKSIDVIRTKLRRGMTVAEVPDFPVIEGVPNDEASELWDAVASLPERQRLAVAYHFFAGMPHAETADRIGGSVESVRRAAADGVRQLRTIFDPASQPEGAHS